MRFAAFFILFSLPSYSQFLPNLQAESTAEYDAYLDVLDHPTPEKAAGFEAAFPHSSLRLPLCELAAKALRKAGKQEQAVAAVRRGLSVAPDYLPLLVELADLLSNSSGNLNEAVLSAQHALEILRTVKAPLRVSPEDWLEATSSFTARAHSSLGLVRFKRNDTAGAITEFESAIAAHIPADPPVHYRLGRLYALEGRPAEAKRHLELAVRTGDNTLRGLAQAALEGLKSAR